MYKVEILVSSHAKTAALGQALGDFLAKRVPLKGALFLLEGDLGAGKTTFVQGLASGLGVKDSVQSPTFVTLHVYEGRLPLYHFDLYRLKSVGEVYAQGFDEFLTDKGAVVAVEWPSRLGNFWGATGIKVEIEHRKNGGRIFVFSSMEEIELIEFLESYDVDS